MVWVLLLILLCTMPACLSKSSKDDFEDDTVLVVLTKTKEATRQFLDYTPEDFAEVNAISVKDLSASTVEWVRKKVQGIPTDEEMFIDIENYRRMLSIQLAVKSKDNVLKAVEILKQRDDVQSASPNYYLKLDGKI